MRWWPAAGSTAAAAACSTVYCSVHHSLVSHPTRPADGGRLSGVQQYSSTAVTAAAAARALDIATRGFLVNMSKQPSSQSLIEFLVNEKNINDCSSFCMWL